MNNATIVLDDSETYHFENEHDQQDVDKRCQESSHDDHKPDICVTFDEENLDVSIVGEKKRNQTIVLSTVPVKNKAKHRESVMNMVRRQTRSMSMATGTNGMSFENQMKVIVKSYDFMIQQHREKGDDNIDEFQKSITERKLTDMYRLVLSSTLRTVKTACKERQNSSITSAIEGGNVLPEKVDLICERVAQKMFQFTVNTHSTQSNPAYDGLRSSLVKSTTLELERKSGSVDENTTTRLMSSKLKTLRAYTEQLENECGEWRRIYDARLQAYKESRAEKLLIVKDKVKLRIPRNGDDETKDPNFTSTMNFRNHFLKTQIPKLQAKHRSLCLEVKKELQWIELMRYDIQCLNDFIYEMSCKVAKSYMNINVVGPSKLDTLLTSFTSLQSVATTPST